MQIDGDLQYCGLYFDLDDDTGGVEVKKDAEKLLDFLFQHLWLQKHEAIIYFSGNRGFHIIIPPEVLGVKPRKDLNEIMKNIAGRLRKLLQ